MADPFLMEQWNCEAQSCEPMSATSGRPGLSEDYGRHASQIDRSERSDRSDRSTRSAGRQVSWLSKVAIKSEAITLREGSKNEGDC